MNTTREVVVENQPGNWLSALTHFHRGTQQTPLVRGSMVMLVGSTLVSTLNFVYNVAIARLLGPAEFSHAAAAVTLLMLTSCINLAFQLITAKLIAKSSSNPIRAGIYSTLLRRAWRTGLALGASLVLASAPLSSYLRMPTLFLQVLAVGFVFYIPLGVKRGGMQGTCKFSRLAASLAFEALVKLISAVGLVWMGIGVLGAVLGITVSVIAAYLLPAQDKALLVHPEPHAQASFREALQAITFFVGQVIINNIDILMVKHFFAADQAGLYAAVALVGRLLYFASWSVTSAMFPLSAGEKEEQDSRHVLVMSLLFVLLISTVFVVILALCPDFIVHTLFGAGFRLANTDVRTLLTMNAVAMAVYAIAVVLITYEMSRRIANTAWLQLVVSGLVILGVSAFHSSLVQVIVVQQVLRALLLIAVAIPFFRLPHVYAEEVS